MASMKAVALLAFGLCKGETDVTKAGSRLRLVSAGSARGIAKGVHKAFIYRKDGKLLLRVDGAKQD